MEQQTLIIYILGGIFAAIGGLFAWFRFKRKEDAEAKGSELSNEEKEALLLDQKNEHALKLSANLRNFVNDAVENERLRLKSEQKADNLEMQLDIERGISSRYESRFADVYKLIGAAEQRERDCLAEREKDNQRIITLEKKIEAI